MLLYIQDPAAFSSSIIFFDFDLITETFTTSAEDQRVSRVQRSQSDQMLDMVPTHFFRVGVLEATGPTCMDIASLDQLSHMLAVASAPVFRGQLRHGVGATAAQTFQTTIGWKR